MSDKYQFEGDITTTVAGQTVHLLKVGPVDVTLSSLPDAVASIEVGSGLDFTGKATLQGAGAAETLDLSATDNVPGLPASFIDTISLKNASFIVSEGVELLEHIGVEVDFAGTITKVAA